MHSAGALNQRVALAAPSFTKDALGGLVRVDAPGVLAWAKVSHVGAGERFAEGAMQTRPELRVVIRWRAGIKLRDTLTWRNQAYEIIAEPRETSDVQKRRFLELLCVKRGTGAGTQAPP